MSIVCLTRLVYTPTLSHWNTTRGSAGVCVRVGIAWHGDLFSATCSLYSLVCLWSKLAEVVIPMGLLGGLNDTVHSELNEPAEQGMYQTLGRYKKRRLFKCLVGGMVVQSGGCGSKT